MINLMNEPSKAKNRVLTRAGLILTCLFLASTLQAGDILIDSGEGQDTLLLVGPDAGATGRSDAINIESDPDNGSLIQVIPASEEQEHGDQIDTIIVTPEIRIKER